ncbi:uncharacterized protein LOC142246016 [Anomaloglossus baeobatrachus]|uniref:uncharacterized protein LOC142246016 n=1 Tax=Anomaloglossus baeobatrachus TaxID=238106 RepID=UPI003F503CC7
MGQMETAREITWQTKLEQVFNDDSENVVTSNSRETDGLIERLKFSLSQKTRVRWNKAFMERYLSKGLIPRGLRIQVFPSFNVDNDDIRKEWEDLATNCSRSFMNLLVKINLETLSRLNIEIEDLKKDLSSRLSEESIRKLNEDLEKSFSKWEKDVIEIKTKKYKRDFGDFKSNSVYRWKHPQKNQRKKKGVGTLDHSKSFSASSLSSLDEDLMTKRRFTTPLTSKWGNNRNKQSTSASTKRKIFPSEPAEKKSKNKTNNLEHSKI